MDTSSINSLLTASGVPVTGSLGSTTVTREDCISTMDQWLGITTTTTTTTTTASSLPNQDLPQQQPHADSVANGLPSTDHPNAVTNEAVWLAWRRILISAWHPESPTIATTPTTNGSATSSSTPPSFLTAASAASASHHHVNLLVESTLSPEQISLTRVWDAVRATHWLEAWMELPLDAIPLSPDTTTAPTDEDDDDDKKAFSMDHHWVGVLLWSDQKPQSSTIAAASPRRLIQALYHHLEQLPLLQAHMHAYTHSLQQPAGQDPVPHRLQSSGDGPRALSHNDRTTNHNNRKKPDMAARLAALQLSQSVSARLLTEWKAHEQRLQRILAVWYRASSAPLRAYTRTCLGRVWKRYWLRTAAGGTGGGTVVTRHENTQAASLSLTLQTLLVIVQGRQRQNGTTAVARDLILELLLPLHQPNALVLWRDQTPVLSLYHEPLTQCMATLLALPTTKQAEHDDHKDEEDLMPLVLQALIQPDIFPMAGHTNKQILLLHEMDTFLGLFASYCDDSKQGPEKQAPTHVPWWLQGPQQQQHQPPLDSTWWVDVCRVVARCMASDHSGLAEQALQLIRNTVFVTLVQRHAESCLPLFLQALVPSSFVHSPPTTTTATSTTTTNSSLVSWNPTVRKMIYLVLSKLVTVISPSIVQAAAQQAFFAPRPAVAKNEDSLSEIRTTKPVSSSSTKTKATTTTTKPTTGHRSLLPPSVHSLGQRNPRSLAAPPPSSSSSGGILGTSWKPSKTTRKGTSGVVRHGGMPPPIGGRPRRGGGGGASSSLSHSQQQPPATITGVAPWATSSSPGTGREMPPPPSTSQAKSKQPPVTITGVAPWAMSGPPLPSSARRAPNLPKTTHSIQSGADKTSSLGGIAEGSTIQEDNDDHHHETPIDGKPLEEKKREDTISENDVPVNSSSLETQSQSTAYQRVLDYMEILKPPPEEEGASSWSKVQMAESPTLLPTLKFHNLVFGHDLGTGSFGTVRYARLIERNKTRSKWPEYAVKIVSMDKIQSLGYESSIQREIAILHLLSHPGIARLISSFRFREGTVYLVLEYASRGDLYTLLRQQGSLDHDATRFVIGELVAALASIHDLGLVYGDLKPENIVITEVGHIKLTDFGACRPVTEQAKKRIHNLAKTCLKNLRNGDWKEDEKAATKESESGKESESNNLGEELDDLEMDDDVQDEKEDVRVEGTTTYLPPEVVLGAYPTQAADSWALGCVLYQCLSGRPPLLDVDEEATRQRIVTFAAEASSSSSTNNDSHVSKLFEDRHSSGVSPLARELIRTTFARDANSRPNMYQIARHEFFASAGVQVFTLYQQAASPLEVGNVAPPTAAEAEDAQWARRQYSSIWAPQPQQYTLGSRTEEQGNDQQTRSTLAAMAASPIPEGKEVTAFFTARQEPETGGALAPSSVASLSSQTPVLGRISERRPFLPSPG